MKHRYSLVNRDLVIENWHTTGFISIKTEANAGREVCESFDVEDEEAARAKCIIIMSIDEVATCWAVLANQTWPISNWSGLIDVAGNL